KNADLIVVGTPISQEALSDITVATKLKVTKVLKGKEQNEIIIYQLGRIGDKDVLNPGEDYYLFLGDQIDNREDTFYIKGGIQGLFYKKDQEILARDPLMQDSMNDLFKDKLEGISFFESWIEN